MEIAIQETKDADQRGPLKSSAPASGCAILCSCGCGEQPKKGNRYIHGHNHRGKKAPTEWVKKRGAGIKEAWASGKFDHLREHSEELIEKRIAPLSGRKRPADVVAKCAAALKGRKLSDEHKRKLSKRWLSGPQNLPKESEEKRRRSISLQRRGTHGYGRSKRDNPLHAKAKHWIIRDPVGRIHEFDNLQAWCRANEKLFEPDDYPAANLQLWRRAVGGFNDMQRPDNKGIHAWKGWTLVSVTERETLGAPDLLGRNENISVAISAKQPKNYETTRTIHLPGV